MEIEIHQINKGNLRCGWCQMWIYSVPAAMSHADMHFDMLKKIREDSELKITIKDKEEVEEDSDVH